MKMTIAGREYEVQAGENEITVDGKAYATTVKGHGLTRTVTVAGRTMRIDLDEPGEGDGRTVNVDGQVFQVAITGAAITTTPAAPVRSVGPAASPPSGGSAAPRAGRSAAGKGAVAAQMAGRVLRIEVKAGDQVEEGALLLILEAMKMENEIRAPRAGTVQSVAVSVGDRVNGGDALVTLA